MQTLRGALRTTFLFAVATHCASTTPAAPTTPAATLTAATTVETPAETPANCDAAPNARTQPAMGIPPEPTCPNGGSGTVRSYACGDPRADEAPGGFAAPYERCPATRGGLGFSVAQTAQRRGQVDQSQTCCYLERCQISYGY
jgi:hypothetical protein